jgi:16S rRNA (guanine527-N7)-methyltransferase
MSPPGRPKGEYRSAQREGTPASPPGRPKGEYRSAQREGSANIAPPDLDAGLEQLRTLGGPAAALPQGASGKLAAYVELLGKWNRTYNLTAIREPERMVTHHVLDALAVLPFLTAASAGPALRVLDVGSGGGVPALPLAIARPSWYVVALDSSHKKGAFLQQAVIELALPNVDVVIARVEDYAPPAPFDVVISRAFSDLATFAQSSARHLAPGGRLVAMKGVFPDEEIALLPPAFRVVASPALAVPGLDAERHLIVMERV